MAKINDSKGRGDDNSGYVRVVGLPALGRLLSRVQATVIRNGNELERLLKERCPYYAKDATLGEIIMDIDASHQKQVFFSYRHERVGETAIVGDVTVVDHAARVVHVVELKDGDTFDTKKASGELASINALAHALAQKLGYAAETHFCAFNQESKSAIVTGAKGRFSMEVAMTGTELCALMGVDYKALREARKADEAENLDFLLRELLAIPEVRTRIEQIIEGKKRDE